MSWSIGYDDNWSRDIGYGVPAYCDHPGCMKEIDRGLAYVCGSEPYGGDHGCGLYFCEEHRMLRVYGHGDAEELVMVCRRCRWGKHPFTAKPDHPTWVRHKLTHSSWAQWRAAHPDEVCALLALSAAALEP